MGGGYLVYQVVLPYAKNILVGSLPRWKGGKEELWMKRKSLFYFPEKLSKSVTCPVTHLLFSGADLHGIGNPAGSFLPGDVDDVFEGQRYLFRSKVGGEALRLIKVK